MSTRVSGVEVAKPVSQRKQAVIFLSTCVVLLCAVFVITGLRPDYYSEHPVDFATMELNQYALVSGLADGGVPKIKLAYFETTPPPRVAMFGHHIVRSMSSEAFPFKADTEYFFNFYFPHISLSETRDLLLLQERNGNLPKDLALVYISHPYLGFRMLTDYRWALPIDFYLRTAALSNDITIEKLTFLWRRYLAQLQFRLDWKHTAYALIISGLGGGCQKFGIYESGEQLPSIQLPKSIEGLRSLQLGFFVDKFADVYRQDCQIRRIRGLRSDGSFFGQYKNDKMRSFNATPRDIGRWSSARVETIQDYAKEIHEIGRRNNLTIVFFIPPLVRKYFPSAGHEHFDQLVSNLKANGIHIYDHRREVNTDYFHDEEHLNNHYFRLLIDSLDAKGLLPKR